MARAENKNKKIVEKTLEERLRECIKDGNKEQQDVFMAVCHDKKNVFCMGSGGVGKSWTIDKIVSAFRHILDKTVIVTAYSGVAAQNVGGVTTSSAFGWGNTCGLTDGRCKPICQPAKIKYADLIIVDECSMINAAMIDSIYVTLTAANAERTKMGKVPCQLMLCGDMLQIPCVVTKDTQMLLNNYYGRDMGRCYPFFGKHWFDLNMEEHELTEIIRQDDEHFRKLLEDVRMGRATQETVDDLNEGSAKWRFCHAPSLYPLNRQVAARNEMYLVELPGKEEAFPYIKGYGELTESTVDFRGDVDYSHINLKLKIGAQVMFTANGMPSKWCSVVSDNMDPGDAFKNGTLGVISGIHREPGNLSEDYILIDIPNWNNTTKTVTVQLKRYIYKVEYIVNKKYANGEIRPKKQVKSEYFQFPLVLAAAISIHKAQGQTYANGINIDPEGAFDYNQIYVGISRSTALDLIHFDHELKLEHIKTDPNVTAFVEGCRFRIAERCAREESERAEKERLSKIEEEKKKKADEEKRKEDLGFFYDFPNLW